MSIPIFFQPLEVGDLPLAGETSVPEWDKFAGYSGEVPSKVKFVDGGLLSNFPINVFHRSNDRSPRMPTFGVRLSTYRRTYSKSKSFFGFGGAIISTMRQIYDYDFLLKNPDYKRLICRIGADQKFNWLNFNISKKEQIALFNLGALKAIDFLENFDWQEYKSIRKNI
jgi:NTE family protein